MKIKFLRVITTLITAAFVITSCLDDDTADIEYSSNASITAFSIDDIETQYVDSVNYENDTTLTVTLTGSDYPFVIDQLQRLIYNVDSLPVGTDVSKVVVNITADTSWILIASEDGDTLWTSTDSLSFVNPVQFKVVAASGEYGGTYTATINVHQQEPDSLQWKHMDNTLNTTIGRQKAVAWNGQIFVFAEQGTQVALTTLDTSSDTNSWSELLTLSLPEPADYSSAMAWGDHLYILADHQLYQSVDGTTWTLANTELRFNQLIAGVYSTYNQQLYAISADNRMMESTDGANWEDSGEMPTGFPNSRLSYAVLPLQTNSYIERVAVMGVDTLSADTATVVWSKLTNETTWDFYPVTEDVCPALENIGMIYYDGKMYAFGGPARVDGVWQSAFHRFYQSTDQGITWTRVDGLVGFPSDFAALYEQAGGQYSFAVDSDNFLWIMWSGSGQVWRGRINRFGFANQ